MQDYTRNQLTGEELQQFLEMIQQEPFKQLLKDHISQLLQDRSLSGLADRRRAPVIFENILSVARANQEAVLVDLPPKQRSSFRRWLPLSIAAALLAVVSVLAAWMWNHARSTNPAPVAKHQKKEPVDVLPGGRKALLTLGNGTVITLDDAANGPLAKQGASTVIKLNGKLDYKVSSPGNQETVYNTISTPRGGQYQVELPDGSMVWLNAVSSIRFPTAFTGPERRVDITGEAYFEVAKNRDHPFVVAVNGSEVTVMGTHFNVMAYPDEALLQTTLFEGSVAFSHNNQTLVLNPLEQSRLNKKGGLDKIRDPDAEDVIAWKNGLFHFDNADIRTVMRQLARWYDVDVEYRITPDDNLYHVEMPRSSKLSSVLKVLELTANIHFSIEERRIIVS